MEQHNSIDSGLEAIELEQANQNEEGLAAEVATTNDSAIDLHYVPPSPPVLRSLNPGAGSTASPIHRFRALQFVAFVLCPMLVLVASLSGMWALVGHWELCWFPYYFLSLNAALQCSLMLCAYWPHMITLILVLKRKCKGLNGPPIQMPLVYPGLLLILYIAAFIAFSEQIYVKPDSIINSCKPSALSTPNSSAITNTTSTDSAVIIYTTTNGSTPLIFPPLSARAKLALRFSIAVEATCALLFATHLIADMCATWTRHWKQRPCLHTLCRNLSRYRRVCCFGVRPACVKIAAPLWWILCLFAWALYAKRYTRFVFQRPRRRRLRAQLLEMLQLADPMLHLQQVAQPAHR